MCSIKRYHSIRQYIIMTFVEFGINHFIIFLHYFAGKKNSQCSTYMLLFPRLVLSYAFPRKDNATELQVGMDIHAFFL